MPTVRITENTTGGTHAGFSNNAITSQNPTSNSSDSTSLELSSWAASDEWMQLFNINPPIGLGTITVSAVRLGLFNWYSSGGSRTLECYEVLRAWVKAEATWNIYSTGNSWTSGGALGSGTDRGASVLATGPIGGPTGAYIEMTGAGLITYVNTQVNAGNQIRLVVHRQPWNADDSTADLARGPTGNDGERPYLEFDYTAAGVGIAPIARRMMVMP